MEKRMMATYSPNENRPPEKTLEDRVEPKVSRSDQPIRQVIVPYCRYDGKLIRLVYDVYHKGGDSEVYCLRPNEGLLNNYE